MLKPISTLFACTVMMACANTYHTDERPQNDGEKTIVSNQVLAMVDQNNGTLDIRQHDNVRCKRIKIVGTHIHKRFCYTTEEEKRMAEETYDAYYRNFGPATCLTEAVCGADGGVGIR